MTDGRRLACNISISGFENNLYSISVTDRIWRPDEQEHHSLLGVWGTPVLSTSK
jgi:hypothetical protein